MCVFVFVGMCEAWAANIWKSGFDEFASRKWVNGEQNPMDK